MPEKYMGPERRIDPENRMGTDWHAARALARRGDDGLPKFANLAPDARRTAITEANFRNNGPHADEAGAMRQKMLRDLDRIEGRRTPEQAKLLDRLAL